MKIIVKLPRGLNARAAIRRCGYGEHQGREVNYWKRLSRADFPRFHIYMEEKNIGEAQFNLHLDQKFVSYEGSHAHSGEYDGKIIEKEAERIQRVIAVQKNEND